MCKKGQTGANRDPEVEWRAQTRSRKPKLGEESLTEVDRTSKKIKMTRLGKVQEREEGDGPEHQT